MNDELRDHLQQHLRWGNLEGDDLIRFLCLALCGESGELANLAKNSVDRDRPRARQGRAGLHRE
jgi:hypothetical protein